MAQVTAQMAATGVFVLLGLVGWVIALAGLGTVQDSCETRRNTDFCDYAYSTEWWALFFQLVCIVLGAFVGCFRKTTLRVTALAFILMNTVLLMQIAGDFTFNSRQDINIPNKEKKGYRAGLAGLVFLLLGNFAWIIAHTIEMQQGQMTGLATSPQMAPGQFLSTTPFPVGIVTGQKDSTSQQNQIALQPAMHVAGAV